MPPEAYRQCASLVVFRNVAPSADGQPQWEVLLLHKPRKKDAWQLPQGGIEAGETLEEAAKRELWEEAGLRVEIFGRSPTVYQYDFPASYRRFRPDNVRGQRLEFVFAKLQDDQAVTVDGKEIDAYSWVSLPDALRHFSRPAYRETVARVLEEGLQSL